MTKKTILLPTLLAILYLSCCHVAVAQYLAPKMSIHLTNPASLLSKAGVRLQYRLNQEHSVLVSYRWYWGIFPGYQGSVAYQHYFRSWERSEAFFYGKVGVGSATYNAKPYFARYDAPFNDPGSYGFVGAGAGKRYNFGPFFIEANVGLKFAGLLEKRQNYNENLFYTLGPASLIDCGLHFGLQFFNESRYMHHKTFGPLRHSRAW
jgi:hypothetical protein